MLDGLDMTEINKASKGKHGIYDGLDSLEDALKKGEDLEGALNKFENEEEDVENEEELKKALLLDQQKRDMANKIRELMETQKGNDKGHDIELLVKKFKEGLDRNAELRNAANLVADALNELRDALRSKDPKKIAEAYEKMFNLATRQIELAKAAAMDPKLPDWQKKKNFKHC